MCAVDRAAEAEPPGVGGDGLVVEQHHRAGEALVSAAVVGRAPKVDHGGAGDRHPAGDAGRAGVADAGERDRGGAQRQARERRAAADVARDAQRAGARGGRQQIAAVDAAAEADAAAVRRQRRILAQRHRPAVALRPRGEDAAAVQVRGAGHGEAAERQARAHRALEGRCRRRRRQPEGAVHLALERDRAAGEEIVGAQEYRPAVVLGARGDDAAAVEVRGAAHRQAGERRARAHRALEGRHRRRRRQAEGAVHLALEGDRAAGEKIVGAQEYRPLVVLGPGGLDAAAVEVRGAGDGQAGERCARAHRALEGRRGRRRGQPKGAVHRAVEENRACSQEIVGAQHHRPLVVLGTRGLDAAAVEVRRAGDGQAGERGARAHRAGEGRRGRRRRQSESAVHRAVEEDRARREEVVRAQHHRATVALRPRGLDAATVEVRRAGDGQAGERGARAHRAGECRRGRRRGQPKAAVDGIAERDGGRVRGDCLAVLKHDWARETLAAAAVIDRTVERYEARAGDRDHPGDAVASATADAGKPDRTSAGAEGRERRLAADNTGEIDSPCRAGIRTERHRRSRGSVHSVGERDIARASGASRAHCNRACRRGSPQEDAIVE